MKRIQIAILILLIPLCCVAFAALTKTTSIDELDAWQEVLAGVLDVGNAGNISSSYDNILYLELAYADNDTQDGVGISIEVSYGDDDWTLLTKPFSTPAAVGDGSTIDGVHNAGDTLLSLVNAAAVNTPADKFFIEDGASSESVRTKSEVGDDVTLCHDLQFGHANSTLIWADVYERIIPIPAGFAYVRVLINNTDANADIYYTTRLSKVTGL